jgi:hypothetical protein
MTARILACKYGFENVLLAWKECGNAENTFQRLLRLVHFPDGVPS